MKLKAEEEKQKRAEKRSIALEKKQAKERQLGDNAVERYKQSQTSLNNANSPPITDTNNVRSLLTSINVFNPFT